MLNIDYDKDISIDKFVEILKQQIDSFRECYESSEKELPTEAEYGQWWENFSNFCG